MRKESAAQIVLPERGAGSVLGVVYITNVTSPGQNG